MTTGNPFDLNDISAYEQWRDKKLERHPAGLDELVVEVDDISTPTTAEYAAILDLCERANMAVYRCRNHCDDPLAVRSRLRAMADAFGMHRIESHRSMAEDCLVALEVVKSGGRHGFIPYTNRPIKWHTDGYYNPPEAPIRAMLLHCVRPAASGGVNGLLDPEIAYIRLRDRDPALIAALMHPEAMSIPPHIEDDGSERPLAVGPVYAVDPLTGKLIMRYTERKRNIIWRDSDDTRAAIAALTDLLSGGEPLLFHHRLAAGEGVICNNVLHDRSGFEDDPAPGRGRLYYRARYMDRIGRRAPADEPAAA